jgi:hypothetical protein
VRSRLAALALALLALLLALGCCWWRWRRRRRCWWLQHRCFCRHSSPGQAPPAPAAALLPPLGSSRRPSPALTRPHPPAPAAPPRPDPPAVSERPRQAARVRQPGRLRRLAAHRLRARRLLQGARALERGWWQRWWWWWWRWRRWCWGWGCWGCAGAAGLVARSCSRGGGRAELGRVPRVQPLRCAGAPTGPTVPQPCSQLAPPRPRSPCAGVWPRVPPQRALVAGQECARRRRRQRHVGAGEGEGRGAGRAPAPPPARRRTRRRRCHQPAGVPLLHATASQHPLHLRPVPVHPPSPSPTHSPCPSPPPKTTQVTAFYDFWYTFKSWREFPHPDEEDVEAAESREHRRWMERCERWQQGLAGLRRGRAGGRQAGAVGSAAQAPAHPHPHPHHHQPPCRPQDQLQAAREGQEGGGAAAEGLC